MTQRVITKCEVIDGERERFQILQERSWLPGIWREIDREVVPWAAIISFNCTGFWGWTSKFSHLL